MPTALQHHASDRCEVNADVCAVNLLLHNRRRVSDKRLGFLLAQVFVVIGPLRAEQMRRARVFDEIVAGRAHDSWLRVHYVHYSKKEGEFCVTRPPVLFLHERLPVGDFVRVANEGDSGSLEVRPGRQ